MIHTTFNDQEPPEGKGIIYWTLVFLFILIFLIILFTR